MPLDRGGLDRAGPDPVVEILLGVVDHPPPELLREVAHPDAETALTEVLDRRIPDAGEGRAVVGS